jgi:predicted secreted protein
MPQGGANVLDTRADAPFEIRLRSPLTAGYEWKADFDPVAFSLVSRHRVASLKDIGASAVEIFRFRPLSQGQYEIRFVLQRAWESKPVDETKVAVRIT